MKTLIAPILLVISFGSSAGELSLQLHGFSKHSGPRPDGVAWNERNYGLGLRYQINDDWSVQGGFYKNSMSNPVGYILGQWTPVHIGPVSAGVFGGFVAPQKMNAAAGAMVNAFGFTLRIVPKVDEWHPAFKTLEYGIKF